VVELRFRDLNTGIYDSYFKYDVTADGVVPLESWVVSRGVMPMLFVDLIVVSLLLLLLLLLVYGIFRLFRLVRKRRGRTDYYYRKALVGTMDAQIDGRHILAALDRVRPSAAITEVHLESG